MNNLSKHYVIVLSRDRIPFRQFIEECESAPSSSSLRAARMRRLRGRLRYEFRFSRKPGLTLTIPLMQQVRRRKGRSFPSRVMLRWPRYQRPISIPSRRSKFCMI